MELEFLTQVGGILKPFAWIMGVILNAIYEFVSLVGIHNIAVCIIIFTFVTKMLMLPLTIKQQKHSRLQAKMSPELTKIQAKYKGKKDEVSLKKQQQETQEVYAKYGTSMMGGCLPLLISLPIMFALYRVIYAVPAYVTDIASWYTQIADAVINGIPNHVETISKFVTDHQIMVENQMVTYALGTKEYLNSFIDILAKFNTANWEAFMNVFPSINTPAIQSTISEIMNANNLFGLSILDSPSWNSISVVVPVLAAGSQFIQGKLQMADTAKLQQNMDNPMARSTKTMTTIMPLMSGVFCLMLPIGVGLYWIASAVFQIIQQIFINRYLDKTSVDELIEKNIQKSNKKKEKMGIASGNRMAGVAKTSTKAIDSKNETPANSNMSSTKNKSEAHSNYQRNNVSHSANSIMANANLLANRNKGNNNPKKKSAKVEKALDSTPQNEVDEKEKE